MKYWALETKAACSCENGKAQASTIKLYGLMRHHIMMALFGMQKNTASSLLNLHVVHDSLLTSVTCTTFDSSVL